MLSLFNLVVDEQPTVDAMPVKHGKWVKSEKHKPWLVCSVCEDCYVDGEWVEGHKWAFCPNCGAKMSEEDNITAETHRDCSKCWIKATWCKRCAEKMEDKE